MSERAKNPNVLYKHRKADLFTLERLNEVYLANPRDFNDPYDCQINIIDSVKAAANQAEKMTNKSVISKIKKLKSLNHIYKKMEHDISKSVILSFSYLKDNVLMWAHYAEEHRGFCLGFRLSKTFTEYNEEHLIVGCSNVHYSLINPFLDYF